jgi:crossover junction endodeoxyribonuclease RusA
VITMRCPWTSPPLRSNQRLHWATKAKWTRNIRQDAERTARAYIVGPANRQMLDGPVVVSLVWEVTDKRRRDVGASGPTLKAWIDGMVDAGMIPRDSHDVVAEERLRIEVGARRGVRVEIAPIERKDTTT